MLYVLIVILIGGGTVPHPSSACDFDSAREYVTQYYEEVFLSENLSISLIEKRELRETREDGVFAPFGRSNMGWEKMKSLILEGDCLINFKTGEKSWRSLSGREGYLLLRGDEIVYVIFTRVS